jgi:SOS response regulatory protein OraA/RecX
MAKLKTYLMEQQMSEAEIEEYLDYLYAEYLMKQESYRYEDNHNTNTMEKARPIKNTGCSGG